MISAISSLFINKEYKIPDITKPLDYGGNWPEGTSQLAKELCGFSNSFKKGKRGNFKSRYYHGLKIIQMLWPNEVEIFKVIKLPSGKKVRIYNNYFLDVFKFLCKNRNAALTGPASSAKTFGTAIYCLLCFYSSPTDTTVLISTTSGSASERRVWADIKSLHDSSQFEENGFETKYGTIIPYLKCITFDPSGGKDKKEVRDLRNGVIVIPIANDSNGDKALETIMGTKNSRVIWVVDELPVMPKGTIRGRTSLISNPYFQFIGIGNAYRKLDQHGSLCQPKRGWAVYKLSILEKKRIEEWDGATCKVLFLHGKRSPNFSPLLNEIHEIHENRILQLTEDGDTEIEITPEDYPFPYLANPFTEEQIAISNDPIQGKIEVGRKTIDYMRYAIGYWMDAGQENVVMTPEQVQQAGADAPLDIYSGEYDIDKFAALDPAFTIGGDKCILAVMNRGRDTKGEYQFSITTEEVIPTVEEGEDFKDRLAYCTAKRLYDLGIKPDCFGIDASGDGGIIAQYIMKYLKVFYGDDAMSIILISSLGKADDSRWYNKVTEFWMNCAKALSIGEWREFDTMSGYAQDFFQRTFENVGRDVKQLLPKKKFKELFGHSPDCFIAGTIVHTNKGLIPIEFIEEGDMIMTPFGYSKCLKRIESQSSELYEVKFNNGKSLTGKGDHTIFTKNKGWVKLKNLSLTDAVDYAINRSTWKFLNKLFTRSEPTIFKQAVDITHAVTGSCAKRDFFIESSGQRNTAIFLKAMSFIISTVIGKITNCPIWNVRKWEDINLTISKRDGKKKDTERMPLSTLILLGIRQRLGISPLQECAGIPIMQKRFMQQGNSSYLNVLFARRNLNQEIPQSLSIAPPHAIKRLIERSVKFLSHVIIAAKNFLLINIGRGNSVPVHVRQITDGIQKKVYNITLMEDNAYYANDVLVSNCGDSLSYVIEVASQRGGLFQVQSTEDSFRDKYEEAKKAMSWYYGEEQEGNGNFNFL